MSYLISVHFASEGQVEQSEISRVFTFLDSQFCDTLHSFTSSSSYLDMSSIFMMEKMLQKWKDFKTPSWLVNACSTHAHVTAAHMFSMEFLTETILKMCSSTHKNFNNNSIVYYEYTESCNKTKRTVQNYSKISFPSYSASVVYGDICTLNMCLACLWNQQTNRMYRIKHINLFRDDPHLEYRMVCIRWRIPFKHFDSEC